MKHANFAVGTEFETCTGQRWRCTDVGQRSITAIELRPELEEAWFCGPPYSVPEVVFDEQDIAGAFRTHEEAILEALAKADSGIHPGYRREVAEQMMTARFSDDARRYPHPRLLRIDRVDESGEILEPYAAHSTSDGWRILVYAPFSDIFSTLPEADFVRLRPATLQDLVARKHR